jgi:hypothetical protein
MINGTRRAVVRRGLACGVLAATVGLGTATAVAAPWTKTAHKSAPKSAIFAFTGEARAWTVPAGVCAIKVSAVGAAGSNGVTRPAADLPAEHSLGATGARLTARLKVHPGQVLTVVVGGAGRGSEGDAGGAGGFNGGRDGKPGADGVGAGGGGGGFTGLRDGHGWLLVAAGGGGGGGGRRGKAGGDGGTGLPVGVTEGLSLTTVKVAKATVATTANGGAGGGHPDGDTVDAAANFARPSSDGDVKRKYQKKGSALGVGGGGGASFTSSEVEDVHSDTSQTANGNGMLRINGEGYGCATPSPRAYKSHKPTPPTKSHTWSPDNPTSDEDDHDEEHNGNGLPSTGQPIGRMTLLAIALVAVGAGLLGAARRRRQIRE